MNAHEPENPLVSASRTQLKRIVRQAAKTYLKYPNINSVGIGYKITGRDVTPILSLQFSVGKKDKQKDPNDPDSIPKELPIDGVTVKTDVIQQSFSFQDRPAQENVMQSPPSGATDEKNVSQNSSPLSTTIALDPNQVRKSKCDPVRPGVSIGSIHHSTGTVGAIVRDRQTPDIYMLSNWHVFFASTENSTFGVVQPGTQDDRLNIDQNSVGQAVRGFVRRSGDCAVASLVGRGFNPIPVGFEKAPKTFAHPQIGDPVKKSGKATNVTFAKVTQCFAITRIEKGNSIFATVEGFAVGADPDRPALNSVICAKGDSGAAWVMTANEEVMVGIHCATNDPVPGTSPDELPEQPSYIACFASDIFSNLGITLALEASPLQTAIEHTG